MSSRFPPFQDLTSSQIEALTAIVFGLEEEPKPADIGFIFGGSHPGLWETAVWAYQQELVSRFIVTGGGIGRKHRHPAWTYGERAEAIVISEKMIQGGVPSEAIALEHRSGNSLDNVLYAMRCIDFASFRSILAITKSYGTGRQLRTLRKHLSPHVEIYCLSFPAEIEGVGRVDRHNWMNHSLSIRFVLGEYMRNILYGARGDIIAVDPIPGVEIIEPQ